MAGRGSYKSRQGISYVQNEEPSFIKAFKEKVGHKEDPGIDAKVRFSNNYSGNIKYSTSHR